ncbi:hypothetical protein ERJ75_000750300 [Trypanosoma vivax]|uniref:QA-SNARE protein n=1 Tax=Trypanosoma vivax (strain Y486) TaxID=1055687 RepID=G0U066_TRYVY|nr:hypothetical protein TRVL_06730 [Trypanosoma vivax]KAH8613902.1 hypothetical protein ERJ75_000750300 [Trypanosoma vivax]CCC49464.1 conserved hypothetical protein [Trypanosoma vivax Y486]
MDVQLEEMTNDLHTALEQLSKVAEDVVAAEALVDKKRAEAAVRPVMREARSKICLLRTELRRMTDSGVRERYEKICVDADERIQLISAEMKRQISRQQTSPRPTAYTEMREEKLLGEGCSQGTGFQNSQQVLRAAINVQNDMLMSLARTEKTINVTEESGQETLQALVRQSEQMYQVDQDLEGLQGDLDRAGRDVRWFFRQLAGDRCLLSLFGVLIVAMAVLMGVMIYKKRHAKKHEA